MRAKDFLSRAYKLDARINTKLAMLDSLNSLAVKSTNVITGMPHNPSGSKSQMADTVDKIVDLETEVTRDIDRLVDIKREIIKAIGSLPDVNHQMLLEQRYICFSSWEEIAARMHYSLRWTYISHGKALESLDAIINKSVQ